MSGGPPIHVADAQSFAGGTWLPDGSIVYNEDFLGGRKRVPTSGGKPEVLTRPDPAEKRSGTGGRRRFKAAMCCLWYRVVKVKKKAMWLYCQ